MGQDSSKLSSKRRVEHGEKMKLLSKDNQAAMKCEVSVYFGVARLML